MLAWVCSVIDHRLNRPAPTWNMIRLPMKNALSCASCATDVLVLTTFLLHLWCITEQKHAYGNMESTRYRDENLTEIRLINTLHLIRIARKGRQKNRKSSRRKPHDPLDLPGDKKFTWWLTWFFLWYALPKNTNREWKRVTIWLLFKAFPRLTSLAYVVLATL